MPLNHVLKLFGSLVHRMIIEQRERRHFARPVAARTVAKYQRSNVLIESHDFWAGGCCRRSPAFTRESPAACSNHRAHATIVI